MRMLRSRQDIWPTNVLKLHLHTNIERKTIYQTRELVRWRSFVCLRAITDPAWFQSFPKRQGLMRSGPKAADELIYVSEIYLMEDGNG